jgi:carbon starvation protein
VTRNRRNPTALIIPLVFLLCMTTWALFIQFFEFVDEGEWVLAPLDAIIFILAIWLIIEAIGAMRRVLAERRTAGVVDSSSDGESAAVTERSDAGSAVLGDVGGRPTETDPGDDAGEDRR